VRAAILALILLAVPAGAARGDDDDLPSGKFGFFGAIRQNLGELGETYGNGWLMGFDAMFQPYRPGQAFSLGLAWSAAVIGRFGADDINVAESPLKIVEMTAGLRLRRSISDTTPGFLFATGGGAVLRTSVPVPPDDKRVYYGGYGGLGYEHYTSFFGRSLMTVEGRYSLLGVGPQSVTVLFGIGWGGD
jgi:hypothetical protein